MLITEGTPLDDRPYFSGDGDAAAPGQVQEAYDNLRVIRQVMERSTKYSTLSGFSGVIVGCWALLGVAITRWLILPLERREPFTASVTALAATWMAVFALSVATDLLVTKSRAVRVGKQVFSRLGLHMVAAAAPGFSAGLAITLYFVSRGQVNAVWPFWMLSYGIAICAVGQFSVRPVSYLGWAFLAAGAATLFLLPMYGLWMMAIAFGGFHIAYGLYTGVTRKDW
ncbi:MAG: hypothetical protein JOZ51_01225 [Chloroflexi bacterium]|nr:hypothetical protein [Chloroflexota bacterium]